MNITTPLIATGTLFFGLVAGQVLNVQAAEVQTIVETRVETVTVERILPVEIEVTVPFDHAQHAESLGYMSNAERVCNLMIEPLSALANDLNTPMICLSTDEGSLLESDYAGFYNGNVVIFTQEHIEASYYAEVGAHELGHAYDATNLTDTERDEINSIMGWELFDLEHYADVVAFDLGYWADYGDGWRHEGSAPTLAQLDALHAAELLPVMG